MVRLVVGATLLLVGVIGGFIPVLQGWIFILLGLSIIAPESARARAWLEWARTKAGASTAAPTTRPHASPPGPPGPVRPAGEGRNR